MGGKVVALITLGDEGAQFDVFPHHLLDAHVVIQMTHAIGHAMESDLGSVWNIGEDRMGHIVIDGLHDGWSKLFAQAFTLQIDVAIGATTEIDTFKRACTQMLGRENLFKNPGTTLANNKRLARLQFLDILSLKVEGGLDHRAL